MNSLLINGFDTSSQDLDFFWVGGSCWILFMNSIQRFKRNASSRILREKYLNGTAAEFVLSVKNEKQIRIQFIFARSNANIPFILYTFDLDIVQVAYDGERIISVGWVVCRNPFVTFFSYKKNQYIRPSVFSKQYPQNRFCVTNSPMIFKMPHCTSIVALSTICAVSNGFVRLHTNKYWLKNLSLE